MEGESERERERERERESERERDRESESPALQRYNSCATEAALDILAGGTASDPQTNIKEC